MSKSFTYYLIILVLKLKGIKRAFSESPINFNAIRKDDVLIPKSNFFKRFHSKNFIVSKTPITEFSKNNSNDSLLIYIPGGAFISGPSQHHWDTTEKLAYEINYTIWMCNYPKAPEHKIAEISDNIDAIYHTAIQQYNPENIVLIGDSAGGTLILALIQRLIKNEIKLPSKIILISPVVDASLENPKIDAIDYTDPMLSKKGVLSAKQMCSDNGNLKQVNLSPIYGDFNGFPNTILFIAENDITYPDQLLLCEKLKHANIKHQVIIGPQMPHIWPLLPIMKEARQALYQLINLLKI